MVLRLVRDEDAPADDGETEQRAVRVVDETPRFAMLWESVLFDPELSANAKVIYAVLQRMAHECGGELFPSQETIAARAGIKNRKTVAACLDSLEARGHIKRVSRGRRATALIVLTFPTARDVQKTDISGDQKTDTSDVQKMVTNKRDNVREIYTPHSPPRGARVPEQIEADDPPPSPRPRRAGKAREQDHAYWQDARRAALFEQYWWDHPRRVGKQDAMRAWRLVLGEDDNDERVMRAFGVLFERQLREWRARPLDKVPHLATWINRRDWEETPLFREPA